jgi:hypothetical protein
MMELESKLDDDDIPVDVRIRTAVMHVTIWAFKAFEVKHFLDLEFGL